MLISIFFDWWINKVGSSVVINTKCELRYSIQTAPFASAIIRLCIQLRNFRVVKRRIRKEARVSASLEPDTRSQKAKSGDPANGCAYQNNVQVYRVQGLCIHPIRKCGQGCLPLAVPVTKGYFHASPQHRTVTESDGSYRHFFLKKPLMKQQTSAIVHERCVYSWGLHSILKFDFGVNAWLFLVQVEIMSRVL